MNILIACWWATTLECLRSSSGCRHLSGAGCWEAGDRSGPVKVEHLAGRPLDHNAGSLPAKRGGRLRRGPGEQTLYVATKCPGRQTAAACVRSVSHLGGDANALPGDCARLRSAPACLVRLSVPTHSGHSP